MNRNPVIAGDLHGQCGPYTMDWVIRWDWKVASVCKEELNIVHIKREVREIHCFRMQFTPLFFFFFLFSRLLCPCRGRFFLDFLCILFLQSRIAMVHVKMTKSDYMCNSILLQGTTRKIALDRTRVIVNDAQFLLLLLGLTHYFAHVCVCVCECFVVACVCVSAQPTPF